MGAPAGRSAPVVAGLGAVAGLAATAALVWGGYRVPLDLLVPAALLDLAVGWSFIGIGLVARRRRPQSRSGLLMVAVGFAWLLRVAGAVDHPAGFVVGVATKSLYLGVLAHLLITYPVGRIETWRQRLLVGVGYLLTAPVGVLYLTLLAWSGGCWTCQVNTVVIQPTASSSTPATTAVEVVVLLLVAVLAAVLGLLLGRWLRAGSARRRELAPAVWGGAAIVAVTLVQYLAAVLGAAPDVQNALAWCTEIVLVGWPVALLLGLLRSRLDRAAAGGFLAGLGDAVGGATDPERLRDAIVDALHDPTAELAFWLPDRQGFVDPRGRPVDVGPPGPGRAVAVVERDGRMVATIAHSDALATEPELVAAVLDGAALAIENQRLHAAARARLAEVRASRRRIVEATDAERRRIERDLHDGAQQRLVSVALAIRLARAQIATAPPAELAELVAEAAAELAAGVTELRELAHGLYPAALVETGLDGAIAALAERSPVPVEVTGGPVERLPGPIEHACWFTASELLANAAKHAAATRVEVDVRVTDRQVLLRVCDDGVGGADPAGSGLRGLADRVAGAGGRLTVHSPPGAGTRAVATFPVAAYRVVPDRDPG